jgi:hypothetical protein
MPGFVHFFEEAGKQVNAFLKSQGNVEQMVRRLNHDFQAVYKAAGAQS